MRCTVEDFCFKCCLWHLTSFQVLLHDWLLPRGLAGLFAKRQLHMGTLQSQHYLQSLSISYSHTTPNNHISPCYQPLPEPQLGGIWWYFTSQQGPHSAAQFWHLVSLGESCPLIFPCQPFCFTPLAIFLFFQAPLPYPARWIRHPTGCILQCHKGTPKTVELTICLSQEILCYPRVSKTALTLTTSWMLLQASCLRLSEGVPFGLLGLVGSNYSHRQTCKSPRVVWDQKAPKTVYSISSYCREAEW